MPKTSDALFEFETIRANSLCSYFLKDTCHIKGMDNDINARIIEIYKSNTAAYSLNKKCK